MHINWPKTRSKSCQWFLLLEICVSWAFALEVNVYLLILAFSLVRILLIRPALELKGLLLLCALQGSLPVILVESFKVYVQILGGLLDLSHSTLKWGFGHHLWLPAFLMWSHLTWWPLILRSHWNISSKLLSPPRRINPWIKLFIFLVFPLEDYGLTIGLSQNIFALILFKTTSVWSLASIWVCRSRWHSLG